MAQESASKRTVPNQLFSSGFKLGKIVVVLHQEILRIGECVETDVVTKLSMDMCIAMIESECDHRLQRVAVRFESNPCSPTTTKPTLHSVSGDLELVVCSSLSLLRCDRDTLPV